MSFVQGAKIPFERSKCRLELSDLLKRFLTPTCLASDMQFRMLREYLSGLDMAEYVPRLDFSESYTTLYDHVLGVEILKQTDIEQKFLEFCGAGRFAQLFGGEDAQVAGKLMAGVVDDFCVALQLQFNSRTYLPELVRAVSRRFKNTEWWKANRDRVSKNLEKNRVLINRIKKVQDS